MQGTMLHLHTHQQHVVGYGRLLMRAPYGVLVLAAMLDRHGSCTCLAKQARFRLGHGGLGAGTSHWADAVRRTEHNNAIKRPQVLHGCCAVVPGLQSLCMRQLGQLSSDL